MSPSKREFGVSAFENTQLCSPMADDIVDDGSSKMHATDTDGPCRPSECITLARMLSDNISHQLNDYERDHVAYNQQIGQSQANLK